MPETHTQRKHAGLLVLGFGGHARSVADIALACGIERLVFVDCNVRSGEHFLGHPAQINWPEQPLHNWACMPASGKSSTRYDQMSEALKRGWLIATLIAPTVTLGAGATVGVGCFVGHHAHIGPMTKIGEGCILNTGCVVDHECKVGAFTHVSVNTTIAGRVDIGEACFIGAGATVIDGVTICSDVTIGAGAVVTHDISLAGTYVGVPARRLAQK